MAVFLVLLSVMYYLETQGRTCLIYFIILDETLDYDKDLKGQIDQLTLLYENSKARITIMDIKELYWLIAILAIM